jgi:chromosome segregation ATPase
MRASTIKSIAMIAGAALGAVLIGLLGTYFVLPAIDSSVTPSNQSEEAVATASDSTANRSASSDTAQANAAKRNSMAQEGSMTMRDEDHTGEKSDSSMVASARSLPGDSSSAARMQALRDSIDALRRRLQETQKRTDTLRMETATLRKDTASLRQKLAAAQTERAKVNELSGALMDMRRRNLSNLLQGVDMRVLKKLYQETTGQARTRLLQAMASDQAAQFVNQVVENDVEPSPLVAPDSASSTE